MAGVSVKFKAVDEISAKFDAMVTAGERALDAFDKMESSADKAYSTVSDGAEQASDAMDRATKSTDYWTDAIGNYDKGAMEAIYTTEELVQMGFKTEDALSEVADTAEKATEELDKFGKESEEAAEKSEEFGDESQNAITGLEEVLTAAGIVMALHEIGAAFVECSDAAAEFETSMAVVSTIADSTVLSSEQISAQIKQVSRDTAIAVTDLADATYGAISASVATADAVAFVEQANQLAVGGFTSQATAVDVLTTAINAYGLSADKAGQLSDYLVTTQNLGKTTVDQLASSIGMVIPSAAAFNVQMDNLSTAYAILTANGVQTAQSTTYLKAMFTELASAESEVAQVLQEETGQSFAELMEQGYSLGDVMQILGDSVDGNTTAFMNMWGSMEAGSGAVSLYNSGAEKYAQVLDQMRQSAGSTAKAYETMTNTTEFSSQRMENSFNNLKIAIGEDLNPVVSNLQNGIAGITDGVTAFIDKYPAVSAILTGVTITLGTVTVAVGAYKAATVGATLATKAWTAVMNMNPVFLAITAVTALTAGLVTMAVVMDENAEKTENLTSVSQKHADELAELNAEYEKTVELYGAESDEAIELEDRISSLTAEYEQNKETMEEHRAAFQEAMDAYEEMTERHKEQEETLNHESNNIISLIGRLDELTSQTEVSAAEQQEILAIIKSLNEEVPGLSLNYDELTNSMSSSTEAIMALAEAEIASRKYDSYYEQLIEKMEQREVLEGNLTKEIEEQTAAQEEYNEAVEAYNEYVESMQGKYWSTSRSRKLGELMADVNDAAEKYNEFADNVETATQAIEDNEAEIARITEEMAILSGVTEDAAGTLVSYDEAVATAVNDTKAQLEELATAYDEAYQAAYDSISGQMGLFESMKTESEQTVSEMQAALETQAEYLSLYSENLQKAADYGLDENLIAALSDGSAESAGQLDAIIAKIEELGGATEGMSEDAQAFVDSFNESFSQVETAKETWADSVAKMETDFDTKMSEIEADMEETIDNMNMADDARANAISTMDAYIEGIKSKIPEVNSALAAITWANSNMDSFKPNGYAVGTSSAEPGLALVGENGPELVDFSGGERVYTAEDTADMLAGRGGSDDFYVAPADTEESSETGGDKTITLKLEGSGEMKVGSGGMSKEDIVEVLIENVKDVLMGIIQQEILEEGDLSYEF